MGVCGNKAQLKVESTKKGRTSSDGGQATMATPELTIKPATASSSTASRSTASGRYDSGSIRFSNKNKQHQHQHRHRQQQQLLLLLFFNFGTSFVRAFFSSCAAAAAAAAAACCCAHRTRAIAPARSAPSTPGA